MEHWADFECALAYHCAPSLVGIKAADLFSWPVEPGSRVADYARAFADRGICLRVLRRGAERMLLLVYRPERLAETLDGAEVRRLLDRAGYPPEATLEELLTILSRRLHGSSFPHEIGLFLGYPPEDVEGFCRHKGQNFKICGCWKVYGDQEAACRCFDRYDRCRKAVCRRLGQCPLMEMFRPLREQGA